MNTVPKVSIVILNYNKKDILRQTIESALTVDWPNSETIVVDNASTDGSADMVEAEFGSAVQLIRRQVNCPTAGRNQGFWAATGKYILSLDNDILLPDKSVVRAAVAVFQQFPDAAALAFKVGTVENPEEPLPEHWWHPVPVDKGKDLYFYTDYFSEGAVFFSAEALRMTGGYDEDFFQYYESVDLMLRMIAANYTLVFCPTLFCAETQVRGFFGGRRTRLNYLTLRNKLWTVWKHYPLGRGILFALPRIAAAAVRSIGGRWPDFFLKAVKDGIFAPASIRKLRRPLPQEVWTRIQEIRRGKLLTVQLDSAKDHREAAIPTQKAPESVVG